MKIITDDANTKIKNLIISSLNSNKYIEFDPQYFDIGTENIDLFLIPVSIDFVKSENPLKDLGLYRITALFPSLPLAKHLPDDELISDITKIDVSLRQVSFALILDSNGKPKSIASISVQVGLENGGLNRTFDFPGDIHLKTTLTALTISVSLQHTGPVAMLQIFGEVTMGALNLDASLSCPELIFALGEKPGETLKLSDVLQSFQITPPKKFETLLLSSFDVMFAPRSKTLSLSASIETTDGQSLSLIDHKLSIEDMSLALEYDGANLDVVIGARFLVVDKICMVAMIAHDSGAWSASLGLDVQETVQKIHPGDTTLTAVPILDLLAAFGVKLPDDFRNVFKSIEIEKLFGSITLPTDGSAATYSFSATFDAQWHLGDVPVQTETVFDYSDDKGSVSATIDIDGFKVVLAIDGDSATQSGNGVSSIKIAVPDFGLSGDYDTKSSKAHVDLTNKNYKLGGLLAEFIEAIKGDKDASLPEPWATWLNEIDLPNLSADIDFAKESVLFKFTLNPPKDFLGCTFKGFDLGYRAKDDGASNPKGFLFKIDGTFPILEDPHPKGWDPTQPSAAPKAPGLGAAYVDIALLAVGQHVGLPQKLNSVDDGLIAVQDLVKSMADVASVSSRFDANAGWLIGGRIILLSQIDIRLLFADPLLYGLVVQIPEDPIFAGKTKFKWLDLVKGLHFEILYRKVSSTIGVYACSLTLPDKLRNVDFNAFQMQLPSFALEIYTNGDFLIDVGFPHNADFSHSAAINSVEYFGSGGFLFGELSGQTASGLPEIAKYKDQDVGFFSSVIELGLGVEIGIVKAFASGPMTAELTVLLQAIFQGMFAKFTTYALNGQDAQNDEYFDVAATLELIGKLDGKIDFSVITATFLVELALTASVKAIAHEIIEVPMSAVIAVDLYVAIDCGLFTIHLHLSFNAQIDYTATFGSHSDGLWSKVPSSAQGAIASVDANQLEKSPSFKPLEKLVLPVGLLAATPLSCNEDKWVYVAQFAVISPETPVPDGVALTTPGAQGATIHDVIKLVMAWLIAGYQNKHQKASSLDELYKAIEVNHSELTELHDYLQKNRGDKASTNGALCPSDKEIKEFFERNLSLTVAQPKRGDQLGLAFFPVLPSIDISSAEADIPKADPKIQTDLIRDYIMIMALAALDSAARILKPEYGLYSLDLLFAKMADKSSGLSAFAGVAGMTTRFLLHGVRVDDKPVVASTGQLAVVKDSAATAPKLTITKTGSNSWGLDLPDNRVDLLTQYGPSQFSGFVKTLDLTQFGIGRLPLASEKPRHFSLLAGKPVESAVAGIVALRSLPHALKSGLESGATKDSFTLLGGKAANDEPISYKASTDYRTATLVGFSVKRVTIIDQATGKSTLVKNFYELGSVKAANLLPLKQLYAACSLDAFASIDKLLLVWKAEKGQTLLPVDKSVLLFRTNLSLESNPASGAGLSITDQLDPQTFITLFLTNAVTNSGGYYLSVPNDGLPDNLFDRNGTASLSLVVAMKAPQTDAVLLPSYATTLVLNNPSLAADSPLYLKAENLTSVHSKAAAEILGIAVKRQIPIAVNPDISYASRLNLLFNIIVITPYQISRPGKTLPLTGAGEIVIGPKTKTDDKTTTHHYEGYFDLKKVLRFSEKLDHKNLICWKDCLDNDPYPWLAGGNLQFKIHFRDYYGNQLSQFGDSQIDLHLTDRVHGLSAWPGLVCSYQVFEDTERPGSAILALNRQWTGTDDEKWTVDHRNNLIRRYLTIYHQLNALSVEVSASFLMSPLTVPRKTKKQADDLVGRLKEDVESILGWIAEDKSGHALPDLRFDLPSGKDGYKAKVLVPLEVTVTMSRTGNVAPELENDPKILTALSIIAPLHAQVDGTTARRYQTFAAELEQALANENYRVVIAESARKGGGLSLLRYGQEGLNVSFESTVQSYAPMPLQKAPLSQSDIKSEIDSLTATDCPKIGQDISVTDYDLDSAMDKFLRGFDRLLEAASAGAMAVGCSDILKDCLAVKQKLAKALSNRVVPVANSTNEGALEAQAAYCNAMLGKLSSYYDIDVVVVLKGLTHVSDKLDLPEGVTLRLYGRLDKGKETPPVHSDHGKLPLTPSQASLSAIPLRASRKGAQAWIEMPPTFRIEAIQAVTGVIKTSDGVIDDGYWMHFVTGVDDATLTTPSSLLPLPLRRCPARPTILGQDFSVPGGMTLDLAMSWSLDVAYRHPYGPHDNLEAAVALNDSSGQMKRGLSDDPDLLLAALAQFEALYPKLVPSLVPLGGATDTFKNAAQAFLALAKMIMINLPQAARIQSGNDATHLYKYAVNEAVNPKDQSWIAQSAAYNQEDRTYPNLVMSIGEYVGVGTPDFDHRYEFYDLKRGTEKLPAADALARDDRKLSVWPLGILDVWNGGFTLTSYRNVPMGPNFIYTAPAAVSSSLVTPHLVNSNAINLPKMFKSAEQNPVVNLADCITWLVTTALKAKQPLKNFRVGLSASLEIKPRSAQGIDLPVQIIPVTAGSLLQLSQNCSAAALKTMPGDTSNRALQTLTSLGLKDFLGKTNPYNARLILDLAIYPDTDEVVAPVLHLTNLQVPLENWGA